MWGKPKVKIVCSECKKGSEFSIPEVINCEHCNEPITLKGSFIKGLGKKGVIATVLTASIAVTQADDFLFPNRYPSSVEFAIINTCISGDESSYFSRDQIAKKRDICICAFDKTQAIIDYPTFEEKPDFFISTFQKSHSQCN